MPVTAPALSGLGMSPHGLVEGSTVMGIYRDEKDMQDFVVIGSLFGRPSNKWKIPNNDASEVGMQTRVLTTLEDLLEEIMTQV